MKIISLFCFPILLLATALEIFKRIVTTPLYPLAYWLRGWARANKDGSWMAFPLWLILDDTIHAASLARGFDIEYADYGKFEPLTFTKNMESGAWREFLRAFSFSSLRNNCINLRDYLSAGKMLYVMAHIGGVKSYYEVRIFRNRGFPYLEIWIARFRIQCGWLTSGIFQVQIRKR